MFQVGLKCTLCNETFESSAAQLHHLRMNVEHKKKGVSHINDIMEVQKGRGIYRGRGAPIKPEAMRRPVAESPTIVPPPPTVENNFSVLFTKLGNMDIRQGLEPELEYLSNAAKLHCKSTSDLNAFVDAMYSFCLKNRKYAHIGALFCHHFENFEVDGTKFRMCLFRKIQHDYEVRHEVFHSKSQFLMNVTLLCEIFYHIRLPDGDCIKILVEPVIQYFIMLLEMKSEGAVELFTEKMQKCYKDIVNHKPQEIPAIQVAMRDALISEATSTSSRALMLMMFEKMLHGLEPFDSVTEVYYKKHSPNINAYCM